MINAVPFAGFRDLAPSAMNRDLIGRDGVGAPGVALAVMGQIDLERSVGLDHPDGTQRIGPISDNC